MILALNLNCEKEKKINYVVHKGIHVFHCVHSVEYKNCRLQISSNAILYVTVYKVLCLVP